MGNSSISNQLFLPSDGRRKWLKYEVARAMRMARDADDVDDEGEETLKTSQGKEELVWGKTLGQAVAQGTVSINLSVPILHACE